MKKIDEIKLLINDKVENLKYINEDSSDSLIQYGKKLKKEIKELKESLIEESKLNEGFFSGVTDAFSKILDLNVTTDLLSDKYKKLRTVDGNKYISFKLESTDKENVKNKMDNKGIINFNNKAIIEIGFDDSDHYLILKIAGIANPTKFKLTKKNYLGLCATFNCLNIVTKENPKDNNKQNINNNDNKNIAKISKFIPNNIK